MHKVCVQRPGRPGPANWKSVCTERCVRSLKSNRVCRSWIDGATCRLALFSLTARSFCARRLVNCSLSTRQEAQGKTSSVYFLGCVACCSTCNVEGGKRAGAVRCCIVVLEPTGGAFLRVALLGFVFVFFCCSLSPSLLLEQPHWLPALPFLRVGRARSVSAAVVRCSLLFRSVRAGLCILIGAISRVSTFEVQHSRA